MGPAMSMSMTPSHRGHPGPLLLLVLTALLATPPADAVTFP
jgi:hypothetical protein